MPVSQSSRWRARTVELRLDCTPVKAVPNVETAAMKGNGNVSSQSSEYTCCLILSSMASHSDVTGSLSPSDSTVRCSGFSSALVATWYLSAGERKATD